MKYKFYPERFGKPKPHWFWGSWLGEWIMDIRGEIWMWNFKRRFDKRPANRKPPYKDSSG